MNVAECLTHDWKRRAPKFTKLLATMPFAILGVLRVVVLNVRLYLLGS